MIEEEDAPIGDLQEAQQHAARMVAPKPEVLHVELVQPAAPHLPLILCDASFLSTLKQVEAQVAALKIADSASAQLAASLQVRLTDAGKKLNEQRLALVRPYNDQVDRINAAAKGPANRIENAKQSIKTALTNYDAEQRRIAAEAERKRQAEIRRLEEIARLEREAEQKRLDEIARQAEEARALEAAQHPNVEEEPDFEEDVEPPPPPEKTATEIELEAVRYAPVAVPAPAPVGVKFRTTLIATVVDPSKVPDVYVERIPKMAAIRATFCTGWRDGMPIPECSGVKFTVNKEPVSDGRGRF